MVAVLLRMDEQIRRLSERVERQEERIGELERKLGRSSRNSSLPPSSDPPGAPPRPGKGPSGRSQGAQPGHEGRGRDLLPTSAVDEVVEHWPDRCRCGHFFSVCERIAVRAPARHQVEELPRLAVRVTEHQCQRVRCPGCGAERTGELPPGVTGSAFGPRFEAAVATLSVRNRVSRRDCVELCEELFGARVSTRTVDAIVARTGDALEQPYEGLRRRVRGAGRVNVDETGWRLRGGQRTLWGAFTTRLALFRIAADRHEDRARELLDGHQGIVASDRWWAYNHLPLARRQLCWAHLRRDFKAHAEGIGAEREFGEAGLRVCDELFWAWEVYIHTGQRARLRRDIRLLRRELGWFSTGASRSSATPTSLPRQSSGEVRFSSE